MSITYVITYFLKHLKQAHLCLLLACFAKPKEECLASGFCGKGGNPLVWVHALCNICLTSFLHCFSLTFLAVSRLVFLKKTYIFDLGLRIHFVAALLIK